MKTLCCPDLHAWYTGPGPESARIHEWEECAGELIKTAKGGECSLTLLPGDLFDVSRPEPWMVLKVIELLQQLPNPIAIDGNHEATRKNSPNFISVLGAMWPEWGVVGKPMTFRKSLVGGDVNIIGIPFFKDTTDDELLSLTHATIAQAIEKPADYTVLMAHYATDISTYSSGEMALGKETVYRMADLESLPVDLVCLGHIHGPKILKSGEKPGPMIIHTGALTSRDHGEEKDSRGFFVVDLAERKIEFTYLPARRFVTIDPTKMKRTDGVQDAYVRFKFKATREEFQKMNTQKWIDEAYAAGAFHVTGIHPVIERVDRVRVEGLTEKTEPIDALVSWCNSRSDALPIEKMKAVMEPILKEVAAA